MKIFKEKNISNSIETLNKEIIYFQKRHEETNYKFIQWYSMLIITMLILILTIVKGNFIHTFLMNLDGVSELFFSISVLLVCIFKWISVFIRTDFLESIRSNWNQIIKDFEIFNVKDEKEIKETKEKIKNSQSMVSYHRFKFILKKRILIRKKDYRLLVTFTILSIIWTILFLSNCLFGTEYVSAIVLIVIFLFMILGDIFDCLAIYFFKMNQLIPEKDKQFNIVILIVGGLVSIVALFK